MEVAIGYLKVTAEKVITDIRHSLKSHPSQCESRGIRSGFLPLPTGTVQVPVLVFIPYYFPVCAKQSLSQRKDSLAAA